MMIDIVTIYLLFNSSHDFDFSKMKNKKIIKDKKKKHKIKNNSIDKIKNDNKKNSKKKSDDNTIEVYDENKSVSLNTFDINN